MTLNITCVGHAYVLQTADGRLSVDGRAIEGWWAKQMAVGCRDGVLAITWTGVGTMGDQPVDMWLGAKLADAKAPEGSTKEAVAILKDAADELVAALPADRRCHTFVVTGYSTALGLWRPLVWYVSNCLDDHLGSVGYVTGPFQVRLGPHQPGELRVTGQECAVPSQRRRELKKRLRPEIPARRVQDRLAEAINEVASKARYQEVVSCNSISLLLERGKSPVSTFYPFDGDPVTYTPGVVGHVSGANFAVAQGRQIGGRPSAWSEGFTDGKGGGLMVEVHRAPGYPYDTSRIPDPMAPPPWVRPPWHALPGGRS